MPQLATLENNLALVYEALGDYEKAAELLEKALTSDLKNFGEDHPVVASRQLNLGTVYIDIKYYDKAKDSIESAYNLFLKLLGEDHPDTRLARDWFIKVNGLL